MAWLDWVSDKWVNWVDDELRRDELARLESMRQEYGEDFACLLEALSHADPIGLLDIAPPSEYAPETLRILEKLPEIGSAEALQKVMYDMYVKMLDAGMAGSLSDYEAPAREFWRRCKS